MQKSDPASNAEQHGGSTGLIVSATEQPRVGQCHPMSYSAPPSEPGHGAAAAPEPPPEVVIAATQRWLERAVIGLNLCPFAKAEHVHGRIRYALSRASNSTQLLDDLRHELLLLQESASQFETTLLIHPWVLQDFLDFNDFLGQADALLNTLELDGILQIASFHPDYQFAGTRSDDVTNYTNRSPYPVLHLLRESSIARAVQAYPQTELIYQRNMRTLEQLGVDGWQQLFTEPPSASAAAECSPPVQPSPLPKPASDE
jgi:hypothetical protein